MRMLRNSRVVVNAKRQNEEYDTRDTDDDDDEGVFVLARRHRHRPPETTADYDVRTVLCQEIYGHFHLCIHPPPSDPPEHFLG